MKYKADGIVEKYKTRLVVKGYTQQKGIDFFETFSLVAKMPTIQLLLAIISAKQWHLH